MRKFLNVRVKIMDHPHQKNNSTTINENIRKPLTNTLKYATNNQIKTKKSQLVQYNRERKKKPKI